MRKDLSKTVSGLRQSIHLYSAYGLMLAVLPVMTGCIGSSSSDQAATMDSKGPVLSMPDYPEFKTIDPGTSEELLAAEGKWNIVEEGDVYDPAQAHLNARKSVNPKQMKKRSDLVAHFEPGAKSGNDEKFRVLVLEPQGADWQKEMEVAGGYQVTETSIAKPSQKVVEQELAQKIRSAFMASQYETAQQVKEAEPIEEVAMAKPVDIAASEKITSSVNEGVDSSEYAAVPLEPEFSLPTKNTGKNKGQDSANRNTATKSHSQGVLGTIKKTFSSSDEQEQIAKSQQPSMAAVPPPRVQYQIISSGTEGKHMADLTGFRSAIHDGKIRIAMDLSSSVKYKVAIDQIRNVLRVKLEKTRWTEPPSGSMRASGLLGTYVTNPQPDGSTLLEIRLKKKTRILDTMILRPDRTAHHRIVIDLQP